MQQITILGNIGRDAVIRDTNGRKAIGFSVAVNESYKDAQGTKVENTTWYNCTIWRDGQQSNRIADYLKAGQQVLVQGQPKPRVYQSQKDGKWYADIDVRVDKIELVGGKKEPLAAGSGADNGTATGATTGPVTVAEPAQTLPGHRDARPASMAAAPLISDENDLPF